ncbi:MAG: 16S rRNA (guanine(966)-N(2))-methyltransferase RsmD [Thermosynechococcus sp. Uc]|uniref:16S rRNA (guanine(966)-N(2))-methyltransferase RsmD n=1 Tax=Thermosynechococcus sp. Uc TaxID=3034853 RepID=UPI0019FFE266|nr:16S rRNA (guanine(966)-N(2))-methyltransferase RsmD [Thermosynechococcus sp. Uc]MDM7326882.1 16S rRNA (guanine(966)-N(2))-methyltransferase RsmD [Thermosynechococcus sp. Uc]HIK24896.1 16S rRNA (guanine(966)-N(2))-methyltransferase RsmD [Thermosynechococcus sp. M46_R2017_013]
MPLRISGQRSLKTLPGHNTRPTSAKVRQAIFNIWQGRLEGCYWLDLCAGTGAMGAEALVRGAQWVVGIEQSPQACQAIRQNWSALAQPHQHTLLLRGDVRQKLLQLPVPQFDLIYFDPPYKSDLYLPVLRLLWQQRCLKPTGEIAVECHTKNPPALEAILAIGWQQQRIKIYGSTTVLFFCGHPI